MRKSKNSFLQEQSGGVLLRNRKKYSKAEHLSNEVLEARSRKLGEDHPHTLDTNNDLAKLYKDQVQYEKTEPLLLEALEGRRLKLGDNHPHTQQSLNNLIDLYEVWNKPEKVKEWRAKLSKAEAVDE